MWLYANNNCPKSKINKGNEFSKNSSKHWFYLMNSMKWF